MPGGHERLSLHLWGKARLTFGGRTVAVRRKALALLYYLELEGPTSRDRLAELLWGHATAGRNLRVELSHLRKVFERLDLPSVGDRADPLRSPETVSLVADDGRDADLVPLEGLDDVSSEFQAWLERKRSDLLTGGARGGSSLTRELRGVVSAPYLLIVQPQFGDAAKPFARELAQLLGLRYRESPSTEPGVHYLAPPYDTKTVESVFTGRKGVFVLEKRTFGETDHALLMLRAQYPIERTRYLKLPALGWNEARREILAGLPFDRAAELYLAADGNPVYLQELRTLAEADAGGEQPGVRVPQRIRSLVEFKMRRLSLAARTALERSSVHPGPMGDDLLGALGAAEACEELEREGWLTFREAQGVWTFRNDMVRRVIYHSLQSGRRRQYHSSAAEYFTARGDALAAAYHHGPGPHTDLERELGTERWLPGWARVSLEASTGLAVTGAGPAALRPPPGRSDRAVGEERALLVDRVSEDVDLRDEVVAFKRAPLDLVPSSVVWELPDEPHLLRFHGRAFLDNPYGVGLSGRAVPLEATWSGVGTRVILAPAHEATLTSEGDLVLPLEREFEYWLLGSEAGHLTVRSQAERGLIELSVTAFAVLEAHTSAGEGWHPRVSAFDLAARDGTAIRQLAER